MPTIFDKILDGQIPSDKVYEDEISYAFKDISPQAPVHILVIPKNRNIPRISEVPESSSESSDDSTTNYTTILGHCLKVAGEIGREHCGKEGFRLVINDGDKGCQTVYHLHIHVLGGRQMTWPPG